jgi:transcriptional regulator with XRE-family HTH domain
MGKSYNQIIREIREDQDKTQAEVAESIKISRATYNRIEMDHFKAKFDDMIELAKYWNVSLDYIAGLTEEPKSLDGSPCIVKNYTINQKGNNITNTFN